IDISNAFGKDKLTWDERLFWFASHRDTLLTDPVAACAEADEPAQALAGLLAYRDYLAGKPIGYLCGLDATASGLQLLSLLSGCEQSASTCNLIATGKREDAYTAVYNRMSVILGSIGVIPRKDVKAALLTHLYGSKAIPKQTFGEGTPELAAFYRAVEEMLPGADELNRGLLTLWNPEALMHSWTLPDGFEVVIKSMVSVEEAVTILGMPYPVIEKVNAPQTSSLCMGANICHSLDGLVVREMGRRCNYSADTINAFQELFYRGSHEGKSVNRNKDLSLLRAIELSEISGFLSAVMFEYVDDDNYGHVPSALRNQLIKLVDSLPGTSFPLVCIHDAFKFHCNYGNDVRIQYAQILSELAASNTLAAIASEITGRPITVAKASQDLPAKILASEYAIT
ncbi:MAG: DNA-directed RNA polymerase, partial [Flavobacteriales bacterium]